MLTAPLVLLPAQPREEASAKANRAAARSAIERHFKVWRNAWKDSELRRDDGGNARPMYLHCHANDESTDSKDRRAIQYGQRIPSAFTVFAVCPSWLLDDNPPVLDEAFNADGPISESRRERLVASRQEVVRELRAAAAREPTDQLVAGQLVRFLLEQSAWSEALDAARACRGSHWECPALVGMVESRQHHIVAAESAFAKARAAMTTRERCQWDDIQALLPFGARAEYANATCARRDEINQRFWWLSNPLYVEPGNDRAVADDERKMFALIRSSMNSDERFRWEIRQGGDAMTEMVQRYGWPSYIAWGGPGEDDSHSSYLKMYGVWPRPPYTTFEYTTGRTHASPEWSVVVNPFSASTTSWSLSDPGDTAKVVWWPIEHFARAKPIVQLTELQTALLRREDRILFASAHTVNAQQRKQLGGATRATLAVTSGPSQISVVDDRPIRDDGTVVTRAFIGDSTSLIASVEIQGVGDSRSDARIRYAITPPLALQALSPGEVAMSDPLLLQVANGDDNLTTLGDTVVNRMFGTTNLPNGTRKIGVYWESYGFRAEDTVSVSVRIDRHNDAGLFRRLFAATGLLRDDESSLKIEWREPDLTHRTQLLGSNTLARAVVLDIGSLAPGDYEITVSVGKTPAAMVISGRRLTIVGK